MSSEQQALAELEASELLMFRDWPHAHVPNVCAGVYSIWRESQLIYVGMSGRGLTSEQIRERAQIDRARVGLYKRLRSHARGRRSGDQFCVYVADRFVLPRLSNSEVGAIAAGRRKFDALVRAYIHEHFAYRFAVADSGAAALRIEAAARRGALSAGKPYLNPLR
jgi:hypothetical protein